MSEAERSGTPAAPEALVESDMEAVRRLHDGYRRIRDELNKVIVGQAGVLDDLLTALFCRGHCLLVGVPGLAKTLMISTLARTLSLSFNRIQFTPDLMPADITGTEVIQEDKSTGERRFKFLRGPIFAQVILADEINRTPPKTQAALLESMQERQVTLGGVRYALDEPFFVLATQNPIEQEGTYPLPEAQLDRFMFETLVDYPEEEEEMKIVKLTTSALRTEVQPVLGAGEILGLQEIVRRVPISDHVIRYALKLVRLTRVGKGDVPEFVRQSVAWGAGPRASQYLVLGGKARAVLSGRYYVSCDDIRAVAFPVLRHRIITNFNAEAEGVTSDRIIERLIAEIPRVDAEVVHDGRLAEVLRSENPR
ncbi:MAG: AAA family ATPase [Planctomycetes bacterium]|nr:AAA family ATPase [Planctomycetota bacterium]